MKKFLILTTALSALGLSSVKAYDNYDNQEILYIIQQMIGIQIPTKIELNNPDSSWNKMKNWVPAYAYDFIPYFNGDNNFIGYQMKYRFPVVHNLADYIYHLGHYVTFENAIQDHILGVEYVYDEEGKMQNFQIPVYEIPQHDVSGYSTVNKHYTLQSVIGGLNDNDKYIRDLVDVNINNINIHDQALFDLQNQIDIMLIDQQNVKNAVDSNYSKIKQNDNRITVLENSGGASASDIDDLNDLVELNSDRIEQNHKDIVDNTTNIKKNQENIKENSNKIVKNQNDIKKNSDMIEQRHEEAKAYTDQEIAKTYDVITQEYTDYVNEQINSGYSNAVEKANAYTDHKFNELKSDIEATKKEARQGAAIGLAASALRFDQTPGKVSVGGGFGVWRGETASAFGLGYTSVTGKVRVNSTAVNSGGHWGANVGVSFTLN